MNRFRRGFLAAASAVALVGSGAALVSVSTATAATHASITLPARGAFSYPWFPEAWNQSGIDPASHYRPDLGYYSSLNVMAQHVRALVYGGFQFDVSSWWGQGSKEDARFQPLLDAAHGTSLKVAPYYEPEGNATATTPGSPNPSSDQLTTDLDYLAAHYIDDPSYLWIAGKPVLFVYGDGGDTCGMADRWAAANAQASTAFYLVLKVFPGYTTCASQPDNWHQYGPAVHVDQQGDHSYSVSPGFWKYDEATPRLARDQARFKADVIAMNCSTAGLRLVTTFNEWGEGTSVEGSTSWRSPTSSYGRYLEILHNQRRCPSSPSPTPTTVSPSPTTVSPSPTTVSPSPTTVSPSPTTTSPTPTPTTTSPTPSPTTTSPSPTPPASGHKVLVVLEENHNRTQAMSSMPYLASLASTYGQATGYNALTHPSLPNYLAIWGGSTFGVTTDCSISSSCQGTAPSVWGQTIAAGKTAKAYQESMPSNCATSGSGSYAPRHGPWPYWTDATERAECNSNDVPSGTTSSGALLTDVKAGTLPVTGELTPNLCNDAHDCSLGTADAWLQSWLPVIMAGPDYTNGRLTIIVTFDEGDSDNNVAFVVVDPRLHGVTVTGTYGHYSLTRWLDDNAGVARLRSAASAPDLRAAFGL